jgi:glutamate-5-semialdehyde dehydrogenase
MSKSATEIAKAARLAFDASQLVGSEERSNALLAVREELERQKEVILQANQKDMDVCVSLISIREIWQL